jgi:hypothetical protein
MPWETSITVEDTIYPVRFNTEEEPTQADIDEAIAYIRQLRLAPKQLEQDQPSLLGSTSSLDFNVGHGAVSPSKAISPAAAEISEQEIIQVFDVIGPDAPISDVQTLAHAYMQSFDNGTSIEACFGINLLNGVSNAFVAPIRALDPTVGGSLHEGLGGRIPNSSVGHPAVQVAGVLPLILFWIAVFAWIHKLRRDEVFGDGRRKALCQEAELRVGPVGVGGWLKFFGVCMLVFSPLSILARALTFGKIIAEARQLDFFAQAELMKVVLYAHIGIALGFASASPAVGWRILKAKADALLWLRRFWWAFWVWQIGLVLVFSAVNPFPMRWRIEWWAFIFSLAGYCVWRLYFSHSIRVANTFGSWEDAAYQDTTFLQDIRQKIFPETSETHSQTLAPIGGTNTLAEKDARPALKPLVRVPERQQEKAMPASHPHQNDADLLGYSLLSQELDSGKRDGALWLKSFSEANGDEAKAQAAYNRARAAILARDFIAKEDA